MSSGERLQRLANLFALLRQQEASALAEIAALDREGEAAPFGSVAKMVADVTRCSLAESRRLAERALALHGSVGLSGTPIPPTLPNTAAAYAEGEISGEHIDRIRGLAAELSTDVLLGESWPITEEYLVSIAREIGPRSLTRPIREFQARLDPDGQEPDDSELANPSRSIRITRRRNRCEIEGSVDTETGLKLEALLDALGKPRSTAANGGVADTRTTAQRHGDSFAEVLILAAHSKQIPECGADPFTILLTADETTLRTGIGSATTTDGTHISAARAQRIACDATVITEDGNRKRAPSTALRRALIARDHGWAHPDCDKPPALTQSASHPTLRP